MYSGELCPRKETIKGNIDLLSIDLLFYLLLDPPFFSLALAEGLEISSRRGERIRGMRLIADNRGLLGGEQLILWMFRNVRELSERATA